MTSENSRNAMLQYGSRTFNSLGNPIFRLYFIGVLGQYASMSMQTVAGGYLIYQLTGSPALLGSMSLAHAVPMIVFSMFGGAMADRIQKKKVLVYGLMASALVVLAVGLTLTTGILSREKEGSWWILIASSFAMGAVMGITLPARQALIPEIVKQEHVMNAVALNTLGMNVLALGAPSVAGFIIGDTYNFDIVYYIMAALYLYAAIMVFFIPHTSPVSNQTGNILSGIQEGFGYIRRHRTIFWMLIFTLIFVVLSMPYQQLLPIYVDEILHVGATGLGFLTSVSGAGALAGSLMLTSLPSKKRGFILLASGVLSGTALIFFAFSTTWILSLIFIAFIGLASTVRATVGSALAQTYTEPPYMGRVLSIMMMQWGIMSLCTFIAGLLAEVMPVQWVIGGLASALIVVTIISLIFIPSLRRMD
jgi:MFS transporter, DHA1 family, staphyloferrin A biosynthesis exporter